LTIDDAILNGNSIIFPVSPFGVFFDLLKMVAKQLAFMDKDHIRMFLVSKRAKKSLAMANIYGEWMNDMYCHKIYRGEAPLLHQALIQAKRLSIHAHFTGEEFEKQPSIVFADNHEELNMILSSMTHFKPVIIPIGNCIINIHY
jgi:hypothetical protein